MDTADVLSLVTAVATIAAVAIALFSWLTARDAQRLGESADRHARMPVLVSPQSGSTTTIANIGNGPALNIAIAWAGEELKNRDAKDITFDQLALTSWDEKSQGHLQPMAAGETRVYKWSAGSVAGFTYTDALGNYYTTLASTYGTRVFEGNAMPNRNLSTMKYPDRLS